MNEIHTLNILVDNDSWILTYARRFADWCKGKKINVNFARNQDELINADVSFFIGCIKIVSRHNLTKSKLNLVVHESDLPSGKGFAPVAWQILEGKMHIPICLIEASDSVDSGDIWLRDQINLTGQELYHEWRSKQGAATVEICREFILNHLAIEPKKQNGEESYYSRRTPADSELDIDKSIKEQFDLFRTVDNENFPAFFRYRGKTYKLEISEHEEK